MAGDKAPTYKLAILAVVLGIAALGFYVWKFFITPQDEPARTEIRVPAADPPLEPDRPDLIGSTK